MAGDGPIAGINRLDLSMTPALFFDRDGTLIVEKDYLSDPDKVELEAGAVEALQRLARYGLPIVGVTNQSGIGRGYFGEEAAHAVNRRVSELFAAEGVAITAWYMCPHAPNQTCDCRKPLTGMALSAARDLDLDLPASFVVGDKRSDVEMAVNFGGTGVLVTTGHGGGDIAWAKAGGHAVADGLLAAADAIETVLKGRGLVAA